MTLHSNMYNNMSDPSRRILKSLLQMTLHSNMYNNMSDPSRRILKSLLHMYIQAGVSHCYIRFVMPAFNDWAVPAVLSTVHCCTRHCTCCFGGNVFDFVSFNIFTHTELCLRCVLFLYRRCLPRSVSKRIYVHVCISVYVRH